ncbi:unnamed protein product [Euphydryas editha]|uniref:Uncharacterized protein n=1 Tax=Euphydryas editha TaxID=104508 RepID=A0AAU9U5K3_EUPED|nr:unnamed protein product [Euphydryas editha]
MSAAVRPSPAALAAPPRPPGVSAPSPLVKPFKYTRSRPVSRQNEARSLSKSCERGPRCGRGSVGRGWPRIPNKKVARRTSESVVDVLRRGRRGRRFRRAGAVKAADGWLGYWRV